MRKYVYYQPWKAIYDYIVFPLSVAFIILIIAFGCTKNKEKIIKEQPVHCKDCPCPYAPEPIPELAPDQKKIKEWNKRRLEG